MTFMKQPMYNNPVYSWRVPASHVTFGATSMRASKPELRPHIG
jgi:hypothetical protein